MDLPKENEGFGRPQNIPKRAGLHKLRREGRSSSVQGCWSREQTFLGGKQTNLAPLEMRQERKEKNSEETRGSKSAPRILFVCKSEGGVDRRKSKVKSETEEGEGDAGQAERLWSKGI